MRLCPSLRAAAPPRHVSRQLIPMPPRRGELLPEKSYLHPPSPLHSLPLPARCSSPPFIHTTSPECLLPSYHRSPCHLVLSGSSVPIRSASQHDCPLLTPPLGATAIGRPGTPSLSVPLLAAGPPSSVGSRCPTRLSLLPLPVYADLSLPALNTVHGRDGSRSFGPSLFLSLNCPTASLAFLLRGPTGSLNSSVTLVTPGSRFHAQRHLSTVSLSGGSGSILPSAGSLHDVP